MENPRKDLREPSRFGNEQFEHRNQNRNHFPTRTRIFERGNQNRIHFTQNREGNQIRNHFTQNREGNQSRNHFTQNREGNQSRNHFTQNREGNQSRNHFTQNREGNQSRNHFTQNRERSQNRSSVSQSRHGNQNQIPSVPPSERSETNGGHSGSGEWHNNGNRDKRHNFQKRGRSQSRSYGNNLIDEPRGSSTNHPRHHRTIHPINDYRLKQIMDMKHDVIPFELLRDKSGYRELISLPNIPKSSILLVVQLLAKTIKCGMMSSTRQKLLELTLESQIRSSLVELAVNEDCRDVIPYVYEICEYAMEKCSQLYLQHVSTVVSAYNMASKVISHELAPRFEALKNYTDRNKDDIKKGVVKRAVSSKKPPNDFRCLSIIPSSAELLETERPFLRENVIKGSYESLDDYLDIQFRLLKEDFCGPIREGIANLLERSHQKNHSFYVYKCVEAQGKDIVNCETVWKFSIKRMNLQKVSDKRLMVGNVVCFIKGNFSTIYVGYIFNVDKRSPGDVHIQFDAPIRMKKGDQFVMVETRALFLAYKFVLQSLQLKETLPFQEEIVKCAGSTGPPKYLKYRSLNLKCLNFGHLCSDALLCYWPSCEDLQVDSSQRAAIHGAFNNKVAIIQGPPGTGKTYIGLKIVEIILDSISQEDIGPILILTYTNHALDQFLEGLLNFTDNILRVGSRSKTESLAEYNLAEQRKRALERRHFPKSLLPSRRNELNSSEAEILSIRRELSLLESPTGIFKLSFLTHRNTYKLPDINNTASLPDWLMDQTLSVPESLPHTPTVCEEWTEMCRINETASRGGELHENFGDGFVEEESMASRNKYTHCYELCTQGIMKQMEDLDDELGDSDSQWEEYDRRSLAYRRSLEVLRTGLSIKPSAPSKTMNASGFIERWSAYNHLVSCAIDARMEHLQKLIADGGALLKQRAETKSAQELYLMREAKIIGLTTTGASRLSTLLRELAPKIIVIEEAAEILEAHCVAPLSDSCEHLILIGDHKQLRPSTCDYNMAKNFHLDVSLFERLVENGHPHYTLSTQHRMRPDISKLLASTLYPDLQDHPSVLEHPSIRGMEKDVFFFSHDYREDKMEKENSSRANTMEALFLMGLCRHLLHQMYEPKQITILTAYLGQMVLLRKMQKENAVYADVRISTVDNFQGEENDIILLSLVRNNEEGKVGFLSTDNRVCVALSRARNGMYIFGNMDHLTEKSELWKQIRKLLCNKVMLGSEIGLKCFNHPFTIQKVQHPEQFMELSPSGGCTQQCSFVYSDCGHMCQRLCHISLDSHRSLPCVKACGKVLCRLGHKCPGRCGHVCEKCTAPVTKQLSCGHSAQMPCYQSIQGFFCHVKVTKTIPRCQHSVEMDCSQILEKYKCTEICGVRLDCGHVCEGPCHSISDPDHDNYVCGKPCARKARDCSFDHKCKQKCGESCSPCAEIVEKTAPCGHSVKDVVCHKTPRCHKQCRKLFECGHYCQRKCHQDCGPCLIPVSKVSINCWHNIKVACSEIATRQMCKNQCVKKLQCGHQCDRLCNQKCTEICRKKVKSNHQCPNGHPLQTACNETIRDPEWKLPYTCEEPCNVELSCGHFCKGTCGQCSFGRIHRTCGEKCERTLICGHLCTEPCATDCPPCQKPCELKCQHSKCKRKCSVNCEDCAEPCMYSCEHGSCKKLCREVCDKEPCQLPCSKTLKCGHKCIGFCGDPCPQLCLTCDQEKLMEQNFHMLDEDEKSIFVELPQCNHVFESNILEQWLGTKQEEIGCIRCPFCRNPVYNLPRYKEYIEKALSNIREVKSKHSSENTQESIDEIQRKMNSLTIDSSGNSRTYPGVSKKFKDILKEMLTRKPKTNKRNQRSAPLTDVEAKVLLFQCNFMEQYLQVLADIKEKYSKTSEQFDYECERLLDVIGNLKFRCSQSRQEEISCELQRLSLLRALIEHSPLILSSNKQTHDDVWNDINTKKFTQSLETDIKAKIKKYSNIPLSDTERLSVVKAMGFSPGHWFKCPNGHFYCIGDCGGAMVTAKCPECKEDIGGSHHQLLGSNSHAPEMDGSKYAAWSEQANLENYQF